MFQKVNETDRNGGGGLYEVLDITVNKIRDYEVGVAIIGKVGTTDTLAVQLSDLTNHRQFRFKGEASLEVIKVHRLKYACLLYTSPSPRDRSLSRMPSSA